MDHETYKLSNLHNTVKGLENRLEQVIRDVEKLGEAHATVLTENIELREKVHVFELNLTEFPSTAISESLGEIQSINSQLKVHTELIAKLQRDASNMHKVLSEVKQGVVSLTDMVQSLTIAPQNDTDPSSPPYSIITTAAALMSSQEKITSPKTTAELNAYTQMLQILEANFKSGGIASDLYQQKRLKFEKRIAELQ